MKSPLPKQISLFLVPRRFPNISDRFVPTESDVPIPSPPADSTVFSHVLIPGETDVHSLSPASASDSQRFSERVVPNGTALGDGTEVMHVSGEIDPMLARVPVFVVEAGDDLDVVGTGIPWVSVDPEFWRSVRVAEDMTRLTRNGIAHAGDAKGETGLLRQERGRLLAADPRRTERVQLRCGRQGVVQFAEIARR